jgi:hypothetical protein
MMMVVPVPMIVAVLMLMLMLMIMSIVMCLLGIRVFVVMAGAHGRVSPCGAAGPA